MACQSGLGPGEVNSKSITNALISRQVAHYQNKVSHDDKVKWNPEDILEFVIWIQYMLKSRGETLLIKTISLWLSRLGQSPQGRSHLKQERCVEQRYGWHKTSEWWGEEVWHPKCEANSEEKNHTKGGRCGHSRTALAGLWSHRQSSQPKH